MCRRLQSIYFLPAAARASKSALKAVGSLPRALLVWAVCFSVPTASHAADAPKPAGETVATKTATKTAMTAATKSPSPLLLELPQPEPVVPEIPQVLGPKRTVWTISSRRACWRHGDAQPSLAYWRFDDTTRCWTASTLEAYLAADEPGTPTCFFVHGNRIGRNQAFNVGWRAYQRIAAQAAPGQRFRFVIWSWPSSQIHGLLKDVRAKAYQSDAHSVYLAWLIDQMNPQSPVSLVGYSYGARLITGSLHVLGGGRIVGRSLAQRLHPDRLPVRAVLMAGAVDNYALAPHARNGLALSQVDRMLVMTNPADSVLRYYRLLDGLHGSTQAIGATGAAGVGRFDAGRQKLSHWNVSRYVGSEHDWTRYLYSPALVSGMQSYTLYTD